MCGIAHGMSQAPSSRPSSALSIIALVSIFLCWPLGFILSIVAFIKHKGDHGTEARTIALIAFILNFALMIPMTGIMAAIAIPNFVKFGCRSKMSEAKGNLKALYVAEESYRAEYGGYSPDQAVIQFTPTGAKLRYQYTILEATKETFRAEARGTGEMARDLWVIDNNNNLQQLQDGCE
jgi:Tfp pilus assembly protein PilE